MAAAISRPTVGSIPVVVTTSRLCTSYVIAPLETTASPCSPMCGQNASIQRSGRPVTNTTGMPASSTLLSTSAVNGLTLVLAFGTSVPSRSVAMSTAAD